MVKNIIISLYGLNIEEPFDHFKLGKFILCNTSYLKKIDSGSKWCDEYGMSYIVYSCNESNIGSAKFNEKFSSIVDEFLNVTLYMIGNRHDKKYKENIFCLRKEKGDFIYCGEELTLIKTFPNSGISLPCYDIDESFFDEEGNSKTLYNYVDKVPPTEIEKKIKLAVSWMGHSLDNRNMVESYMSLSIALEVLLSGNNSPLERGVAYQLREFGAFLAADTLENRMSIYKTLKELYNIRCSISHRGTAKNLSENKYYELFNILKSIIHKLFVLLEQDNINTFEKLKKYIENKKFI